MDVAVELPTRTEAAPDTRVWTVFGQNTLPKLFRHVVEERGDKVAMREKKLGIWRSISWREYGENAERVGLGLVALGLGPKDVVSIIAENCPEWAYTDMGALSVGGVTNGIYSTDSPSRSSTSSTTAVRAISLPRTRSSSTRSSRYGAAVPI